MNCWRSNCSLLLGWFATLTNIFKRMHDPMGGNLERLGKRTPKFDVGTPHASVSSIFREVVGHHGVFYQFVASVFVINWWVNCSIRSLKTTLFLFVSRTRSACDGAFCKRFCIRCEHITQFKVIQLWFFFPPSKTALCSESMLSVCPIHDT